MRKLVQLAGALAQFGLADDGTTWFWGGAGWQEVIRGPLPQPTFPTIREVAAETRVLVEQKKAEIAAEVGLTPLKRKPGRPRKVQP